MGAYDFDSGTGKEEAGSSLSSKLACSSEFQNN